MTISNKHKEAQKLWERKEYELSGIIELKKSLEKHNEQL
jgi:hypothetical protein